MIPIRQARAIAALTAASRVLGMVREMAFASIFGAGMVADAFRIAFQLPNTFRRIFGEGALSSAMIPVLSRVRERQGLSGVWRVSGAILGIQKLVLGVIVALGVAGLCLVLPWAVAWADDPEKAHLTGALAAILFPYMILICMTAAQGGILNAVDSFVVPALAPVLFNIVSLAGFAAAWIWTARGGSGAEVGAVYWVAGAVLAAGVVQYASQAWGLRRAGGTLGPVRCRLDTTDPDFRDVAGGMVPIVVGLAPAQIGVLLDSWIAEAAIARDGAVAHLGFGHVLVHLPLAVIGVSVATAAFPLFSRLGARADAEGLAAAVASACRQVFFLLAPAAVGLILFARPIVRLIYQRGEFDEPAVFWTARVAAAYGMGLLAYGFQQILVRALYSLGDRRTPGLAAAGTVLLGVGLNLAWVGRWAESGIAMASAVAAWANALALACVLRRRLKGVRFPWSSLAACAARTALGCALLAAFLMAALPICDRAGARGAAFTLGAVLCGVLLYLGVAWMVRSEECAALFSRSRSHPGGA